MSQPFDHQSVAPGFPQAGPVSQPAKVLLFGGSGMLGADLQAELQSRGIDFHAPSHSETDITDPTQVVAAVIDKGFTVCFNCAAFTAVDLAETERDQAFLLNAIAAGFVAQACGMAGLRLIHVSTDFVFDGAAHEPYAEDASPRPLGVYGASKLEGERSVVAAAGTVVRTSWLYGVHGKSFPRTILNAFRAGRDLRVVSDQVGCPTSTVDLSRVLVDLATLPLGPPPGIFHACGPDVMSWFDLARNVIEEAGGDPSAVVPIATEDWPTPAKRPPYSVMSTERLTSLGIAPMRPAQVSLREFVQRVGG